MILTIYYSNREKNGDLEKIASEVQAQYSAEGADVNLYDLEESDLSRCSGCWNCWWKNPGSCSYGDSLSALFEAALRSDRILFISPAEKGIVSGDMHLFLEKVIPLLHPFNGPLAGVDEKGRPRRKYPTMAAVLGEKTGSASGEDKIRLEYFDSFGRNQYGRIKIHRSARGKTFPLQDLMAG